MTASSDGAHNPHASGKFGDRGKRGKCFAKRMLVADDVFDEA
ncbi:hypothetical protein V2W30_01720 [Streptomyces sp. Q6]|uniref:Uncharacterized protein n=1 Tax=Streptomyces citrinus TaxID=3118173 RepID=A0ACD5A4Z4_9ACTN